MFQFNYTKGGEDENLQINENFWHKHPIERKMTFRSTINQTLTKIHGEMYFSSSDNIDDEQLYPPEIVALTVEAIEYVITAVNVAR